MSVSVAEVIAAMSRTIQSIEQERVIKGRSERAKLSPESQPIQDAIDAEFLLFKCYGLSDDDAGQVRQHLTRRCCDLS